MYASVADVGINRLAGERRVACLCGKELGSDGGSHGVCVSLAERTRAILYATLDADFGMSRSGGAPLAQLHDFVDAETSCQRQLGVEHRRHVSRVEVEAVAAFPRRAVGVGQQEFRVKHIDEICSTHCAAWMAALCLFHHCGRQNAYVVCRVVHRVNIVHKMPVF